MNAIGGRAAAEADPADVGGIKAAGADVVADDGAVGGVVTGIEPAEVGAIGVVVGGVNGGSRGKQG